LDIHEIIPEETLKIKHQILKIQSEISKIGEERDQAKTLFEIRMNKSRHE
jgi:hypothetical protein